ncbi:uncharacterized protein LOC119686390 [Teleopsis dalmanni]|uniref:uncharacterized protein LOC119686390 n=1 Tax=Teleopsis dalmanni TaxID=139649 RepID=UPI0018CF3828|nr:uncharacterized protein LOC119686390 [Teleopsis dalmanni]
MQEEIHLEDFFWTGSGDAPPDYLKKVHTGISKGKDVIVKTETVVATVYVDGNNEIDIPICLDCLPDDGGGGNNGNWGFKEALPHNYSATDRRYWLLTVMSGFYSQKDNPMLEEKLARLYRLAFTRQQSRHLGINGVQEIAGLSVPIGRERRENNDEPILSSTTARTSVSDIEIVDMAKDNIPITQNISLNQIRNTKSELVSSEESEMDIHLTSTVITTTEKQSTSEATDYVTFLPWELIQQNGKSEKSEKSKAAAILNPFSPTHSPHPVFRNDHVRIVIHNISQITEDDVQSGNFGNTYDDDVNSKLDERPIANQTELIYSVFVNGRPVLASTAANDMKLVSEAEVSDVIGKEIYMKAERISAYLREPQATPLAPATRSGSVGFIDSIQNNTALVVVSSIALLLLLLLLIALLLMGRSHVREKHIENTRSTSRNELLSENQSGRVTSSATVLDTERSTIHSRDVGVQNMSFEKEQIHRSREARIQFPGPPQNRRGSITSTDNTSDSSVYCPINPPTADVQRILDEKAANLFERHKRRHHQYDHAEGREETAYTTILSEKKREKQRYKTKRRYLSENRVGSLETSPVQRLGNSSGDDIATESVDGDTVSVPGAYQNYERAEAYNPHNNYHRNKLLHQKSFYVDPEPSHSKGVHHLQTTEAINKEIIRTLQPSEKSSDTGSIGSFLSMASVKAFPKNTLPEPLNRVLDPVFVTYYDNVENTVPTSGKSHKSQRRQRSQKDSLDGTTIATIESFPIPKAPMKTQRLTSQSDNADPGVVGPIVWERHKKSMSGDKETGNDKNNDGVYAGSNFSPIRDPAAIRNHYGDLLEGAMQMYTSHDDLPMPLPTRDFTNNRKPTKRENRGSSAGIPSYSSRPHSFDIRPSTAQPKTTPKSNQSTQPPSPTTGAWGGSLYDSHSTLVRPMSAGPIQYPMSKNMGSGLKSKAKRTDSSAAPIIEAIQNELRRFKEDKK